ncbi:DUF6403 family protein [Amycolatopsis albispora]|uniref:Uncharacterized protein n=1 Tax=Amycolatopsis albispora TaxID=1804986 RepID=A0A344LGM3_9PSEU|nr:DUF6403 family protein [Amycolatopsis albispora]AXB47197.1 hypothetical protein A4R43_36060 [Amycolatopsis albispora]
MGSSWPIWLGGIAVLVAAGTTATLYPHAKRQRQRRGEAWAAARSAIQAATIRRDACEATVPEADDLLARAEAIAAEGGGPHAAERAENDARRAGELWREAAGE